jgi:hypothetical protein
MPFKQCFLFFLVTTLTKRDNIVMGYLSKPHDFTGTTCDWMDWKGSQISERITNKRKILRRSGEGEKGRYLS